MEQSIFSIDEAKAGKSQKFGWLNAIHYMSPYDLAGVGNLCPHSTPGCRALCLGEFSGQAAMHKPGAMSNVQVARRRRAVRFMTERQAYLQDVAHAIGLAYRKACRKGYPLAVRLNGSTDIAWEGIKIDLTPETANGINRNLCRCGPLVHTVAPGVYRNLMTLFPFIQFLDYTKSAKRLQRELPPNYDLTLSRSERNENEAIQIAKSGKARIAVVFDVVPRRWHGLKVVDGDKHDLRHLDPVGVVVGLAPKGWQAKRDQSGFVVRLSKKGI
jgi:hypothetical protein